MPRRICLARQHCVLFALLVARVHRGDALVVTPLQGGGRRRHPTPKAAALEAAEAATVLQAAAPAVAAVPAAVSLGAGMLGGAMGVGVAYPLDTLKTKAQSVSSGGNPLDIAYQIVQNEGVSGFYSGVSTTMVGQALIKGVTFFVYEGLKGPLAQSCPSDAVVLVLAAAISGAAGSFVVTPVERIKCVMQSRGADAYASPIECILEVARADGMSGLLFRGLGATLLREIPAYAFYFVSYEFAKSALLSCAWMPASAVPLLGGAVAGAMAWIPVYPIDVVKTNIQVSDGSDEDVTFLATARQLWELGGFWAFWDGINPKLARAIVNHAVTFYIFDLVCTLAESPAVQAV